MNNYLKILLHLKKYEGDGKLYSVEELFPEKHHDEIKKLLVELQDEKLIRFSGRDSDMIEAFFLERALSTGEQIPTPEPEPFKAQITLKGSIYLKEELQMIESGKYL